MPMIDVYAPRNLFPPGAESPARRRSSRSRCYELRGSRSPVRHLNNTGAYIHRMPATAVNTAASGSARTVRVQVLTPPGALKRPAQSSWSRHHRNRHQDLR